MTPAVSVILCHHVGRDLVTRCLASLKVAYPGLPFEVLVVTSDDTYTPPSWVRTIRELGGPAHKRNVGVLHAQADTLVFLDDDVEISPYCLYQFWLFLTQHPRCGMAFGKLRNMERRQELDDCGSWLTPTGFLWARAQSQEDTGQFEEAVPCLASKSACCAIRRDAFTAAGGFDARYFILGEETDLAWRCWLVGWEVWYAPLARGWHAFNSSLKPAPTYYTLERIHTYGARNYLRLLSTHLELGRLSRILPLHLLAWLVSAGGFLLRGQGARGWGILRGLGQWVGDLPRCWTKRLRVQGQRQRSDAQLLKLLMHSPSWRYYAGRLWQYVVIGLHG